MPDIDYLLTPPSGVINTGKYALIGHEGRMYLLNTMDGSEILMPDTRSDYDRALAELNAEFPGMNKENML